MPMNPKVAAQRRIAMPNAFTRKSRPARSQTSGPRVKRESTQAAVRFLRSIFWQATPPDMRGLLLQLAKTDPAPITPPRS